MLTGITEGLMTIDKVVLSFNSDVESTDEYSSNEILEKLRIVKSHTDLVIYFASWYSRETGRPFPQMLKVGLRTLIRSVKTHHMSNYFEFDDYLRNEITNEMLEFSEKSI